jgi:fibronectin type 3 domain-containing protein
LIIVGAPPVPSGVSVIKIASQTKSYVEIDWQAVVGASSYRIYRGVNKEGPFELIGSTTGTQLLDANPLAGTVYYKVSALSAQGAEGFASTPTSPSLEEKPPEKP